MTSECWLTHFAPDHPSSTALFPLLCQPRLSGNRMLHIGTPVYANRNRILIRPVDLFPVLCTTSSNVFCLKLSGIWEREWIFKVVIWTHDRCTKINKTIQLAMVSELHPFLFEFCSVAYPWHTAFIFGDSNWKFCEVSYPEGTLTKTDIQMNWQQQKVTLPIFIFFL